MSVSKWAFGIYTVAAVIFILPESRSPPDRSTVIKGHRRPPAFPSALRGQGRVSAWCLNPSSPGCPAHNGHCPHPAPLTQTCLYFRGRKPDKQSLEHLYFAQKMTCTGYFLLAMLRIFVSGSWHCWRGERLQILAQDARHPHLTALLVPPVQILLGLTAYCFSAPIKMSLSRSCWLQIASQMVRLQTVGAGKRGFRRGFAALFSSSNSSGLM